ncbi:MAG: hypothetical protein V4481_03580 [Patescibacteria group bacterium]
MPRRVQDIVPGNQRSIRDIPVEHEREDRRVSTAHPQKVPHLKKVSDLKVTKSSAREEKEEGTKATTHKALIEPPAPPARRKKASSGKWVLLTFVIIVVVAGIGFVASTYFSRATFTITPKTIPVSVNGTYVAQHADSAAAQASADTLIYETITVRSVATSTVAASDGPTISTKAQGKVTIYNVYGQDSQQLIAGSRLSNSSGKVYRLTGTVTVPGGTANNPGTIQATVVADQTGQIYNIAKGEKIEDLQFLGYKGTPRYDAFYARLASDISGGYEGKKKTVSPAALASTSAALKAKLSLALEDQVKGAVPEGYIMYDSMNTTSYSEPAIGGTDPTKAEISVSGIFNGIIFKKDRLASRLAGAQSISSFGKFAYETPGLEKLTVSIANPKDFDAVKKTPLLVKANGSFEVRGIIPADEIKAKLAGIPLAHTQEILQSYGPVIQSASGELIPPWAKVPSDPDRINVVVKEK